jgi:heterodisulfide reductase subunit B
MSGLRYLYFPGCKLTPLLPSYDRSVRALLAVFDIALDVFELNCCGYPVRQIDFTAAMLCGARVLAVAAQKGLPILTPCKCCYGNLKQADYWMRRHDELRHRVNGLLKPEGLVWSRDVVIRHLLNALVEDVGLEQIGAKVTRPLKGLKVAAHYGCHALRPGDVTQFDNPLAPTIFENLLAAAGAQPVDWPLRLDCCGHPLREKNSQVASALMQRKRIDAVAAGAQILVTACTYCQIQFEQSDQNNVTGHQNSIDLPAVLVSQILGCSVGLSPRQLGLPAYTCFLGNRGD